MLIVRILLYLGSIPPPPAVGSMRGFSVATLFASTFDLPGIMKANDALTRAKIDTTVMTLVFMSAKFVFYN